MATLYKTTVAEILEMISDYRGESTTNTDAKRIRAVSRNEKAIAKRKTWDIFHLKDQTATGDSTNEYVLGSSTFPARTKGLTEVYVGGTTDDKRYEIVTFDEFKVRYNENNTTRLVYQYFDETNDSWKMHISPAPETGVTITYSYFWLPPERTQTTDAVYCVDFEALARATLGELLLGEDERDEGLEEKQLAEQIIDEEVGWDNSSHRNQHRAIGRSNTSGIGTY